MEVRARTLHYKQGILMNKNQDFRSYDSQRAEEFTRNYRLQASDRSPVVCSISYCNKHDFKFNETNELVRCAYNQNKVMDAQNSKTIEMLVDHNERILRVVEGMMQHMDESQSKKNYRATDHMPKKTETKKHESNRSKAWKEIS